MAAADQWHRPVARPLAVGQAVSMPSGRKASTSPVAPPRLVALSTLGKRLSAGLAERERSGGSRGPTGRGAGIKSGLDAPSEPATPSRPSTSSPKGGSTGSRLSPNVTNVSSDASCPIAPSNGAPSTGLLTLSRRLSGAHIGQRPSVDASERSREIRQLPSEAPDKKRFTEQHGEANLGLLARGRALGEAIEKKIEKKAKLSHTSTAPVTEASVAQPVAQLVAGSIFKRERLAEWMELSAQHAPPVRQGRHNRPSPGGIQDAYIRAVRGYLTESSLLTHGSRASTSEACKEEMPTETSHAALLNAGDGDRSLLLRVVETFSGPEGFIVTTDVVGAARWSADVGIAVGQPARLLVSHRHPSVHRTEESFALPIILQGGSKLLVRGLHVLVCGPACQGLGPLLLPIVLSPVS